ncbi:hypothetical protein ANME2D_01079 [Candidatus Methanoperedens nitroreducens]|uniref:Uncharacterized protein n=1 Tax=Candidatus Methanoperedens nitratireducens TaxID=1392998 RepID=A0A062V7U2_9EURY|nr:hypothetical protein [Candidatus Methanoperedens nitroreducens]KCZ72648.1 hypothetical protein ANME2D_01079 [Candidatus Methanoperedens nitroreducens]MDJ1423420.1 hypothetical protein [Candidatus Methanoperedens sp.]
MKKLFNNDSGQLILIACVSVVLAIVLIAVYEYSTLGTGEKSINRENMDSFYYYKNIRERYTDIYKKSNYLDINNTRNLTVFEKELKEFALLHGYSVDFIRDGTNATIIYLDKDIKIEEKIE